MNRLDQARDFLKRYTPRGGLDKYELAQLMEVSPRTAWYWANEVANRTLGDPLVNTLYPDYKMKFTQDILAASVYDDSSFRYQVTRNRNAQHKAGNSALIGLPARMVPVAIPKPDLLAIAPMTEAA